MFLTNNVIVAIATPLPLVLIIRKLKSRGSWSWAGLLLWSSIFMICIFGVGHLVLIASARHIVDKWSPDKTRRVAIYQLPHFSSTPGSGSDGSGFVRVYDANGKCLHQLKFDMIQSAQVTWFNDAVEIGSNTFSLR